MTSRAKGLTAALIIALLMALCPALTLAEAAPPPEPLTIRLVWQEGDAQQEAFAVAVPYPEYDGAYWLQVPPDILLKNPTVYVTDTLSQYAAVTGQEGVPLLTFVDAGDQLASGASLEIMATDAEGQPAKLFTLYLSTTAAAPAPPAAIPAVDVPVYYTDDLTGENVSPMQLVTCEAGEHIIVARPQNDMTGYTLISPDAQVVTVDALGANPPSVTFFYRKDVQPVTPTEINVHYRTADGAPVADSNTFLCYEGDNAVPAQPVNLQPNYVLLGDPAQTVTLDANGLSQAEVVFTYYYEEPVVEITPTEIWVHYRTADGTPVADSNTFLCYEGANAVPASPINLQPNYLLLGDPAQTVTLDENGLSQAEVVFTYYYEEPVVEIMPTEIFVHYRTADGTPVADSNTFLCYEGANAVPASPINLQPNYLLLGDPAQTVTLDENGLSQAEVVFTYYYEEPVVEITPTEISVHYRTAEGLPVADSNTFLCVAGDNVVPAQPMNLQPNYVPLGEPAQIVTLNENGLSQAEVVFTFYYEEPVVAVQPVDIPVYFRTADERDVAPAQVFTCYEGTNTIVASPVGLPDNCVPDGETTQTVTLDANGLSAAAVTFRYRVIENTPAAVTPVDITVFYRDRADSAIEVASSQVVTCYEGQTTINAAPLDLREHYQLVSEPEYTVTLTAEGISANAVVFEYEYMPPADPEPAPKVALVTVYYKSQSGQVLYTETVTCVEGAPNAISVNAANVPADCTLNDDATKMVTVDANGAPTPAEVVFQFLAASEVQANVPVHFRTAEGQTVATSKLYPCFLGANSIPAAPDDLIAGYVPASEGAQTVQLSADGTLTPAEVIFFYKPAVTEAPVQTPSPYHVEVMDAYCYPSSNSINFRSSPTTSESNILQVVAKSDLVHVTGALTTENGEVWYQAQARGVDGYLLSTVVRLLSQNEALVAQGFTAVPEAAQTPNPETFSDGTPIDRWGRTTKNVNFRSSTSTASINNRIAQLRGGAMVWVYEAMTVDGVRWYNVRTNGRDGYVSAEYIDVLSQADSDAHQLALPSPMPTTVVEPDTPPTDVPVTNAPQTDAPATDAPATEAPPTPSPAPEHYAGYALTTVQTALRMEVSLREDAVLASVPAGTLCYLFGQTYVDNECWNSAQVIASGLTGFMHDGALRRISIEEANVYLDSLKPTQAPTETPPPQIGYAMTLGGGVPLRTNTDTNARIEVMLQENDVVRVLGQEYVDGVTWHAVQYAGLTGYIHGGMVRMLNDLETTGYLESLRTTVPPVAAPTPAPVTQSDPSSYGYVTGDRVNLRTTASTTSASKRLLSKYAFALVLGQENMQDGLWYRVNQAGTEGYIMAKYFKVLSMGELTEFLRSPEYQNASTTESTGATSPDKITSLEDFTLGVWTNPNLAQASYEPFNPYATQTPNVEAIATGTPTPSPEPTATIPPISPIVPTDIPPVVTENTSFPTGLVIGAIVLLGAAGGAYVYAIRRQNQRRAAERAAQRRRMQQQSMQTQQPPITQQARPYARQTQTGAAGAPIIPPQGSVPRPPQMQPSDTQQYRPTASATQAPVYPPRQAGDTQQYAAPTAQQKQDAPDTAQETRAYAPPTSGASTIQRNRRAGRK